MCHSVHVRLSESERKQAVRLTGVMLPVYASVALAVLVAVYVTRGSPSDRMLAASSNAPAATHGPVAR